MNTCLQFVLGGNPLSFPSSCLEERVLRFAVSSKLVGLSVLQLGLVASKALKVAFSLCNDRGFSEAISFSKRDSGPSYD